MKKKDVLPLLILGSGVFWYLYRQSATPVGAGVESNAIDLINPASPEFVVNKAANAVGIDLHGFGQKIGAGLYDLTH